MQALPGTLPFQVAETGDLVLPEPGLYTSFPSLCRDVGTDDILLLYRTARYDPGDDRPGMDNHGLDGSLYTKRLNPQTMAWSEPAMLVDANAYPPGLIDGNISNLGDRLHLLFRRAPHEMPMFYTIGPTLEQMMMPLVFPIWPKLDR